MSASNLRVFEIPSRISVFLLNVSCCSEPLFDLSRSTLPPSDLSEYEFKRTVVSRQNLADASHKL